MKKTINKTFVGFLAAFVLAVSALLVPPNAIVSAQCGDVSQGITGGVGCGNTDGTPDTLFGTTDSIFTAVVNTLLFLIGAICVIMLIWGGIRYTTSAGNSTAVSSAKNTIMYAVIGLIIAFLAYAIVNWVLGSLSTGTGVS